MTCRSIAGECIAGAHVSVVSTTEYAASDPDTLDSDSLLGRMVTLQVAQLIAGR